MHGWQLFLSVFGVIFVAELPDKTTLAALVLATRHKPSAVLVGAALALTVQSLVAVAAGRLVALLPERPVHVVAGIVFVVSAIVMWVRKEDDDEPHEKRKEREGFGGAVWTSLVVVFIAEWGDLTQLATAALAARYEAPVIVFAGSALALWTVCAMAVSVGHHAAKLFDPEKTKKVAALLFLAIGVALVAGLL